jgi:hypothetical protein
LVRTTVALVEKRQTVGQHLDGLDSAAGQLEIEVAGGRSFRLALLNCSAPVVGAPP